ncbi:MAG TPA: DUF3109 family protein, partial [Bacteroidales bacterium]|nr:DUF3109 family protein [Bacteroidales bacterium]
MFQIDDKLISEQLFEKNFVCNLNECKGACCVEGDSGAPLEDNEIATLKEIYPIIEKYLTNTAKKVIKKHGVYRIDNDGDMVTPLIKNRECVYAYKENNILKCAIEEAFLKNEITFRKPISCYLFPIRVKHYKDFTAINYEEEKICKPALILGKKLGIPVFRFLKEPIIIRFGETFY